MSPGRQLQVLIIEDNHDTADSLQQLLDLCGYEVKVAYDGPGGVRAAQEWGPDVVLCDIGLPGLNGYGVAQALRQHRATSNARLIAITAYDSEEARKRSHQVGFERHFVKPVDLDVLLQALGVPG
jgi:CheY-like chemotaxis protein